MSSHSVVITHGEKSTVTFTGEIPWSTWSTHRADALRRIGESVSVDGFRKGHVPEDVLIRTVGTMAVLEETAHDALIDVYPQLVRDHKIDAIGRPTISLTKIAEGSDLGFTITTSVMPVLTLPDYKALAKELLAQHEDISVTDEELQAAVRDFAKLRYHHTLTETAKKPEEVPQIHELQDADIPELTTEDILPYGAFTDLDDFKKKLSHNLLHEKENRYREKKRVEVLDTLVTKTQTTLPDLLVDHEVNRMLAELEYSIIQGGMEMKSYLEHIKKTEEELRAEMRPNAEKRALLELVIQEIANREKLSFDPAEFDRELEELKKRYRDLKDFDEARARVYLHDILINRAVIEFLEAQGTPMPSHHEDEHGEHHHHDVMLEATESSAPDNAPLATSKSPASKKKPSPKK